MASRPPRGVADAAAPRPAGFDGDGDLPPTTSRQAPAKRARGAPPVTCVYVQNLPPDATAQEVAAAFAKCGVVRVDDEGAPRVKLYKDERTGAPNGTALVNYMQAPSVQLAVNILDGTYLRGGFTRGEGDHQDAMKVEQAQFAKEAPPQAADAGGGRPSGPAAKRAKVQAKQQRARLFGWDGDDNLEDATQVTVVLSNVFDAREMAREVADAEAAAIKAGEATQRTKGVEHPLWQELSDDVFAGAEAVGPVEHMKVFHRHPRGVVRIRFKFPRDAARCVATMDGRFFGGRKLSADLWDGADKHTEKIPADAATADEEEDRLERFMAEAEESEGGDDA